MISETLTNLLKNIEFNETPGLLDSQVNIDAGVWISAHGAYGIEGLEPDDVVELRAEAEMQLKKKIASFLYGDIIIRLLNIHLGLTTLPPSKVADRVWVAAALKSILNEMGVSTEVKNDEK